MRKTLVILLVIVFAMSLVGCDKTDAGETVGSETNSEETVENAKEESEVSENAEAMGENAEADEVDVQRKSTLESDERYEKITIGINSDPNDLMPVDPNAGSKPLIYFEIYECLFDLENGEYIPVLAKDYTIIDDLHYEVEIYDYIYDSAGNHITADDILFCYDYLINSGYALKYQDFESIKKIDDYTVEFTWAHPITGISSLEFPWCRTFIFSQAAFEAGNFATAPVATGPYVVSEFTSGSQVVLEANDDYWQEDESLINRRQYRNVQTIEFDIIAESQQHVIALQTGAIDYSANVPYENIDQFMDGGQYAQDYATSITQGQFYYCFNANQSDISPCQDENLRFAMYYAIDNEAVAEAVGSSIPCKAFGTPFFEDYNTAWEENGDYFEVYDPELAKEYLEKSDYDGETLVMVCGNDETSKNMVVFVQSMLLNVGITTEIQTVDPTAIGQFFGVKEGWDLICFKMSGPNMIGSWNLSMNNKEFGTGSTVFWQDDAKLQEMFETCYSIVGHTPENMTELYNYIVENAYYYSLVCDISNKVYVNEIAELYFKEGKHMLPGACTYYLD